MNTTPQSLRTNIVFVGKSNCGKSSLMNKITRQETSIVSAIAGTTGDVVKKNIEIPNLGPCVLCDTAGIDDKSELDNLRSKKTLDALKVADLAVLVIKTFDDISQGSKNYFLYTKILEFKISFCVICTFADAFDELKKKDYAKQIENAFGKKPLFLSNIIMPSEDIINKVCSLWQGLTLKSDEKSITGSLVKANDVVLLVMPQDKEAPKGRLILPQVQTIRELLDKDCVCISTTPKTFLHALSSLSSPPKLIITDSSVFDFVYKAKPEGVPLTSFSLLFAYYKSDGKYFLESVKKIADLTQDSCILISECCTHTTSNEDIGRVVLPSLLRKKIGSGLKIDFAQGIDFPANLSKYSLVIQCGGCMFSRNVLIERAQIAKSQGIPMTNYGMAIAYLNNILDKVVF